MARIFAAPSVRRLPSYLQIVREMQQEGREFVSGTAIAEELQLESIQVRKDLALTGITGKPKKGYPVDELMSSIERFLGWDSTHDAVLVGAGNLGSALLGYQEFLHHGLNIITAFDIDPKKINATIHSVKILSAKTLDIHVRSLGIKIAILAVPSGCAQESSDILAGAGIEGIWNFTNVKLKVPHNVSVQQEDLSAGYAMLCALLKNMTENDA